MSSLAVLALTGAVVLAVILAFTVYVLIRYTPAVGRVFGEAPLFMPMRITPQPGGEDVRFPTRDGLELAGTYYPARTPTRAGVIVFCHEFLGDRYSVGPYAEALRDEGFDLFAFDFRHHGQSGKEAGYEPMQWVSNREVRDLRAAMAYLRSRPDADPAGVGLFGVSRGGAAALCVAGRDSSVWGVATDGAFPTKGTVSAYIQRFGQIFIGDKFYAKWLPRWLYDMVSWTGRVRIELERGCRYEDVEGAVRRLGPRPWLLIHGEKDAYIPTNIARRLFAEARPDGKEMWIVPKAKHNRCREIDPAAYRDRLCGFFRRIAPRRATKPGTGAAVVEIGPVAKSIAG